MKYIYLDYQATTPCDNKVISAMMPYFHKNFANPHSTNYEPSQIAKNAIENARSQIAELINCSPSEIIFTSGATESNNLAIKGIAHYYKERGTKIITSSIEHKCILESCLSLRKEGFEVVFIEPQKDGTINPTDVLKEINANTILVSIMHVNNEIGTIQPIEEIFKICKEKNVFFHTDAAQALGKIPVNAKNCNLMSLSAHKIYGPKGIGALYISKNPRIRLTPIIHGGGQERGMRSGTLSTALCVGFGKACEICSTKMEKDNRKSLKFRDYFHKKIMKNLQKTYLNGSLEKRIFDNLNYSFFAVEGESLILKMHDICVSTGSACTSEHLESSYVLNSIGVEDGLAHSSIRICFGRYTTFKEVKYACDKIISCVKELREMSPLW